MKTTDSVMREFDNKYPQGITALKFVGGDWIEFDVTKEIKDLYSHSLAEARREIDERCERAEKLLDDVVTMFGKQNSDLHIIQEVRDLMALRIKEGKSVTATWRRELDLLTGDNPERKV